MRRLITAAFAAFALTATPASAGPLWGAWKAPAEQYPGVVTEKNVPITMSDGIVLFADVLHPADAAGATAAGHFPVLLTQTPYNKNVGKPETEYMVRHGYVQVIVDVRGTGSSEGVWDGLGSREQRDGYELVEWAASRPWSDGRVGLRGNSYLAVNQFFTAAQHPKGLRALFPIVPMGDAYRDLFLQGGQVNTDFLSLWYGLVTGTSLVPATYAPSDPGEAARVLANHAGGAAGYQGGQAISAASGGDVSYDGPAYRTRSPLELLSKINVPVFITGGWFDLFQRGEPMLFGGLQKRHVPVRLLMGPWYHNTWGAGLPHGASGIPSMDEIELRWMDHYVKGLPDHGLDHGDIPPVTYYENGSGTWRTATKWRGRDVRFTALRLAGPASTPSPGTLSATTATASAPDTLIANPAAGTCTRSTGQWTAGEAVGTPCDEDDSANDALSGLRYRMPITKPMSLLGPITAHLFVSSLQGRDSQITARVEDVAPGGKTTQISAGWQVLSFRALDSAKTVYSGGLIAQPYHPFTRESVQAMPGDDAPVQVDVEIFPTGWRLLPGHTLQLTLQTSDAPHLTPTAPQAIDSAGATLSIYHDATHASMLVVPVRADHT